MTEVPRPSAFVRGVHNFPLCFKCIDHSESSLPSVLVIVFIVPFSVVAGLGMLLKVCAALGANGRSFSISQPRSERKAELLKRICGPHLPWLFCCCERLLKLLNSHCFLRAFLTF